MKKKLLHAGCGPMGIRDVEFITDPENWEETRMDLDERSKPDLLGSIIDIRTDSMVFDAVYCSHCIEHLDYSEVPEALSEFYRVLKPGGLLMLACPDMKFVAQHIIDHDIDGICYNLGDFTVTSKDLIYGWNRSTAVGNEHMRHKSGFTKESLARKLICAGFTNIVPNDTPGFDLVIGSQRPGELMEETDKEPEITVYVLYNNDTDPVHLGSALLSLQNEPVIIRPFPNKGTIRDGVAFALADCKTQWLSFVDSDDLVIPGIFKKLLDYSDGFAGFVYCDETVRDELQEREYPGWSSLGYDEQLSLIKKEPYLELYRDVVSDRLTHHRGIFNISALKGFKDNHKVPDLFIQGQLIRHLQSMGFRTLHLKEVGYIWRIHGKNSTIKYLQNKEKLTKK